MSGWWFEPLWKIWKSIGMIIPNIWENKKCSKPPTMCRCVDLSLMKKMPPDASQASSQGALSGSLHPRPGFPSEVHQLFLPYLGRGRTKTKAMMNCENHLVPVSSLEYIINIQIYRLQIVYIYIYTWYYIIVHSYPVIRYIAPIHCNGSL